MTTKDPSGPLACGHAPDRYGCTVQECRYGALDRYRPMTELGALVAILTVLRQQKRPHKPRPKPRPPEHVFALVSFESFYTEFDILSIHLSIEGATAAAAYRWSCLDEAPLWVTDPNAWGCVKRWDGSRVLGLPHCVEILKLRVEP